MSTVRATPDNEIAARLAAEFEGHIPKYRIEAVIAGCFADLRGIPAPTLPELGERLARQRLLDLIVRGQDMAIRAREAQLEARHSTDQYIRQVSGGSADDQIADAKALHESGAITAAEFEQLETRALEQKTPRRGEIPSR